MCYIGAIVAPHDWNEARPISRMHVAREHNDAITERVRITLLRIKCILILLILERLTEHICTEGKVLSHVYCLSVILIPVEDKIGNKYERRVFYIASRSASTLAHSSCYE